MRHPTRIATPLLVFGLLAGCAGHATAHTTTPAATDTTTATLPGAPMDADTPTATTAPTWDGQLAAQADTAADAAITAWTAKGLDPGSWWDGVARYLTGDARTAYAGTDPANVPGTRVAGTADGVTAPVGDAAQLAAVPVPTDAGDYTVLLSRVDPTGQVNPWLVERMTPPGGRP